MVTILGLPLKVLLVGHSLTSLAGRCRRNTLVMTPKQQLFWSSSPGSSPRLSAPLLPCTLMHRLLAMQLKVSSLPEVREKV